MKMIPRHPLFTVIGMIVLVVCMLRVEVHGTETPSASTREIETTAYKLFVEAIKNMSTAPNYVLITVLDTRTGARRVVCTEAPFLLGAIQQQLHITQEESIAFALAQRDRTFQFSQPEALKNITPQYTDTILDEVRDALQSYSNEELMLGLTGKKTEISKLFIEQTGQRYVAYRDAMAHVVLERGLLPARGCIAGYLFVRQGGGRGANLYP